MSLPKRNSADGRCYWMKPEVQEELQPLFDQCIQDAIDGRITRLDSLWPPVVVSSEGAPFEVHALVRKWTEAQQRLRDLLCTDTWFQGVLPTPAVVIFTTGHDKILLLQLLFQQAK